MNLVSQRCVRRATVLRGGDGDGGKGMRTVAWDLVVGDIYAAASDPKEWDALPARLAPLFGASMCTLWSFDASTGRPRDIVATTLSPEAMREYAGEFYRSDPWRAVEHRAGWDKALPGSAMVEDATLARSGYYADFGRRQETFHLVGSRHQLSARDKGIASKAVFCRPRTMAPFDAEDLALLDRLIPHLRRAWQLRHQIAAASAKQRQIGWDAGFAGALQSLPGAALAVDGLGRVRFANAAAERLAAQRVGAARVGAGIEAFLWPGTAAERTVLRRAVADAAANGTGGAFLLGAGQPQAMRVVVVPLPGVPGGGLAMVQATAMTLEDGATAVERAMRLFRLSRAEAEVTLALARGLSPSEIAAAREVAVATVRTLLLRAQGKVGAADLRALVVAATLLRDV